jgi:hypothetical protein
MPDSELLIDSIGAERLKTAHWRWALDLPQKRSTAHFPLRHYGALPLAQKGISVEFIPVHFV